MRSRMGVVLALATRRAIKETKSPEAMRRHSFFLRGVLLQWERFGAISNTCSVDEEVLCSSTRKAPARQRESIIFSNINSSSRG